jgi:hypothetical protein
MPDYSKSIIYRIVCKDPNITDEYIGSTTNHIRRKALHKHHSNNENNKQYNMKLYKFIRSNGGFENFDMIMIEEYPCKNKLQLETRERYWIELRKPSLNCNIPTRTDEEYRQTEKCKQYQRTEKYKQYQREYQRERRFKNIEERKKYILEYKLIQKLKNDSAIIIQRFFKKSILK